MIGISSGKSRREEGFTLVEMMIALLILALFLGAIGTVLFTFGKMPNTINNIKSIQEDGAEAIDQMTRQLRCASYLDPPSNQSSIAFLGDLDGNGTEDAMQFEVQGGYLCRKNAANQWEQWISGATGLTFVYWYFDPNTKQLVQSPYPVGVHYADIERIDIRLQLTRGPSGNVISRSFSGSVQLRNQLRQ
jgi:prepilin-type N-terminal cleavage/methylation domain-containing protein